MSELKIAAAASDMGFDDPQHMLEFLEGQGLTVIERVEVTRLFEALAVAEVKLIAKTDYARALQDRVEQLTESNDCFMRSSQVANAEADRLKEALAAAERKRAEHWRNHRSASERAKAAEARLREHSDRVADYVHPAVVDRLREDLTAEKQRREVAENRTRTELARVDAAESKLASETESYRRAINAEYSKREALDVEVARLKEALEEECRGKHNAEAQVSELTRELEKAREGDGYWHAAAVAEGKAKLRAEGSLRMQERATQQLSGEVTRLAEALAAAERRMQQLRVDARQCESIDGGPMGTDARCRLRRGHSGGCEYV